MENDYPGGSLPNLDEESKSNATPSHKAKPRERAARAAELARALLVNRTSEVQHCPKAHKYGLGVEGEKCPACKQPPGDEHVLPPCGETLNLTRQLHSRMLELKAEKLKKLESTYPGDSETVEELLNEYCYKPLYQDESGAASSTEKKKYTSYVIGVIECVGLNGVEYYAACSGFNSTPVYEHALSQMQGSFAAEGLLRLNTSGQGAVLERFPTSANDSSKTPPLQPVGNNKPGTCAAPKLIQRAIEREAVPFCMTELRFGKKDKPEVDPDPEPSCTTCQNNLQQMLCGLKRAQETIEETMEARALREWEEEKAWRKSEEWLRKQGEQAKQREKEVLALAEQKEEDLESKRFDSWYDLIANSYPESLSTEFTVELAQALADKTGKEPVVNQWNNSEDQKMLGRLVGFLRTEEAAGGEVEKYVDKFFEEDRKPKESASAKETKGKGQPARGKGRK